MLSLKDKVIIITGASSGIGKALVEHGAREGLKIVMAARNLEKMNEISRSLTEKGAEVLTVKTDVSVESDCHNLIEQTIDRFGRIDILVNNAGLAMRALFEEVDLAVIHRLMDVNFWGTVYCTKYALPHLLKARGTVAGIISIAGYIGLPGRTGYSASKYAVRGFLETLRVENLKEGLHVLIAAPGFTATNIRNTSLTADGTAQDQSPRDEAKMMTAEAVAVKIFKAIRHRRRTIILTFTEGKLTVFLRKFFPALVDRLAYVHLAKEPDSPFR
jgi:short-subunit dehydrogenase